VQQRVGTAVEDDRLDPEPRAQLGVERRGCLDPPAVEVQVGVPVVDELVDPPIRSRSRGVCR
jgi:hypothetical protein